MGVIFDQSAKNLTTTYLGFAVGAVNTLFLYTHFLTPEYYGLVGFLLSAANLIWPLMAFGVHNTLVKFYSSYQQQEEKDRLLTVVLFLPLGIAALLGGLGWIFYGRILDYFSGENGLVQPYVWLIFLIALATAYFEIFFAWSKIQLYTVFGNFMKEVFHRVCISLLLLSVYLGWLTVPQFIYGLSGVFVLRTLAMMWYALRLRFPKLRFAFPANRSFILKYSALILIAGSVAVILLDLDKVMIEHFLPIEMVAVYGIAIYIASVIAVPSRAMHQITYPMTASLLNQKDWEGLEDLYRKTSLNLLLVSGLIFLLIITNVRQVYELIPEVYRIPFSIVVLISCVKLYDNLLGNNNSILFNSDYYRLVLGIGVLLAAVAFALNLLLIPRLGLYGAALATFLAFASYNTTKLVLVFWKFRIQPFTQSTLYSLGVICIFAVSFYFWDFGLPPIAAILCKSLMIAAGYGVVVYGLGLSPEINQVVKRIFRKVF